MLHDSLTRQTGLCANEHSAPTGLWDRITLNQAHSRPLTKMVSASGAAMDHDVKVAMLSMQLQR